MSFLIPSKQLLERRGRQLPFRELILFEIRVDPLAHIFLNISFGDCCDWKFTTLFSLAPELIIQFQPTRWPQIVQQIYRRIEISDWLSVLFFDHFKLFGVLLCHLLIFLPISGIHRPFLSRKSSSKCLLITWLLCYLQLARFEILASLPILCSCCFPVVLLALLRKSESEPTGCPICVLLTEDARLCKYPMVLQLGLILIIFWVERHWFSGILEVLRLIHQAQAVDIVIEVLLLVEFLGYFFDHRFSSVTYVSVVFVMNLQMRTKVPEGWII